jgi:hypothetical protein
LASATTSPPGHAQVAKKKCKKQKRTHKCERHKGVMPPVGTAPRPPETATLTVLRNPGFGGSVTSTPSGIDCGSSCTSRFDLGTAVVLSTQNAPGYRHSDWSGGGCAGNVSCGLVLNADTTVTAIWAQRVTMSVLPSFGGTASISSVSPFGVCTGGPPTTSCTVDDGDTVKMQATATMIGWGFLNWSGTGCTPATDNPLVLTAAAPGLTCTATFSS